MRVLPVRSVLLIACLVLASVTIVQGVHAFYSQRAFATISHRLYGDVVVGVSYARRAGADFREFQLALSRPASPARDAQARLAIDEAIGAVETLIVEAAVPATKPLLDELLPQLETIRSGLDGKQSPGLLMQVGGQIDWLAEQYAANGAVRQLEAKEVAQSAEQSAIVAMVASAVLALLITLLLGRLLVRPLRRATEIAESIAAGNLANEIRVRGSGEAARLLTSLAGMQDSLSENLRRIDQLSQKAALVQAMAMSNRLKSEFMAHMSHELRTPLNAIIGFSEVIKGQMFGPVGNARYAEYAADIFGAGKHLLKLVNDVLDMSKIEAGKLELQDDQVELEAMLQECLMFVRPQAEKAKVKLAAECHDQATLVADEIRLKQIVLNLLSNAVKFTPQGGSVSVTATVSDDGCTIRVTDTGIGMAQHEIEKAVQPFAQIESHLTRTYDGTGLGLSIAGKLAALHGGSLDIRSEKGIGTTVSVRLPPERLKGVVRRVA